MKKNKIFVVVVLLIGVIGFLTFSYLNKTSKEILEGKNPSVDLSLLIKEHNMVIGNPSAKVTIVEFLDPECESCRAMHPVVKHVLREYEGKVKLVIRYMPLHGSSTFAAAALEEARELGLYDQALEKLFERQPEWGSHHDPKPDLIPVILAELGIDAKRLDKNSLIQKHGWKVDLDKKDAETLGVKYTPTFFVNGRMLHQIGYDALRKAINKYL